MERRGAMLLQRNHFLCLQSFIPISKCKFYLLTFCEFSEAIALYFLVVNKYIITIFAGYKPVAFSIVKPLYSSYFTVFHITNPNLFHILMYFNRNNMI